MPHMPEAVTYDEYEEMRDDGLRPPSIHQSKPYTVRLRKHEHTREHFADDTLALILRVRHLGRFSIIGAKVRTPNGVWEYEFGLNYNGILFNHEPMPEDLDSIPYKAEAGYFIGDTDGIGGNTDSIDASEKIYSPDQLLAIAR